MMLLSLQAHFSPLACAYSDDDGFDKSIYAVGTKSPTNLTASIALVYSPLALLIEMVLLLNAY